MPGPVHHHLRWLGYRRAPIGDRDRDGVCRDSERGKLLRIDGPVLLQQELFPLKELAYLVRGRPDSNDAGSGHVGTRCRSYVPMSVLLPPRCGQPPQLWITREWHSVLEHCYALTSASTISRTRWALAWPPVAFITAPTMAPAAATLPPRIFSAMSGWAASASSTAAVSAASSDTTARPRAATTSSGSPSPASTPSTTWRAKLLVNEPSPISAITRATCSGVIGSSASSMPRELACWDRYDIHHDRASAAGAPASTVAAMRSSAPALTRSRNSRSDRPHWAYIRAWRCLGSSGSVARRLCTHSSAGAIGTRSGSGKYR